MPRKKIPATADIARLLSDEANKINADTLSSELVKAFGGVQALCRLCVKAFNSASPTLQQRMLADIMRIIARSNDDPGLKPEAMDEDELEDIYKELVKHGRKRRRRTQSNNGSSSAK